ncbi:MAG: hypothetical protein ABIQ36_01780 [Rhodanobacter sp.]
MLDHLLKPVVDERFADALERAGDTLALWLFRDPLGFRPSAIGYSPLSPGLALWVTLASDLPAH